MATDSRSQLKSQINVIRTETEEEANTRGRVASVLDKLVDSSYNKKDDELDTLSTNLSPDFHLGNVIDEDPKAAIVYPVTAKDIVINTGGSQVLYPARMGNLVLTRESDIRGVGYAYEGNEFSITNRSGKIAPLRDNYSGAPANTRFDLGGDDLMMENNKTYYFKGNGTHWVLRANPSRLAFSDAINSVNTEIGVGPDGLEVISNVQNRYTGHPENFKEIEFTPSIIDGNIFKQVDGKYLKKVFTTPIDLESVGVVYNSESHSVSNYQIIIQLINLNQPVCVKGKMYITPANLPVTSIKILIYGDNENSEIISISSGILMNIPNTIDSFIIENIKITTQGLLHIFNKTSIDFVARKITLSNIVADGAMRLYIVGNENLNSHIEYMLIKDCSFKNNTNSFIQVTNVGYDLIEILDNKIYNFLYNFFYNGITGAIVGMKERMKLLRVNGNVVRNSDDLFLSVSSGLYYCFILTEGYESHYTNNSIYGVKSVVPVGVYDIYQSSSISVYTGNSYENCLCFTDVEDYGTKTLYKGKGGKFKRVEGNSYTIKEEFITSFISNNSDLGLSIDNCWVSYCSFDTATNFKMEFFYRNNHVDVYFLKNIGVSSTVHKTFEVEGNHFTFNRLDNPFINYSFRGIVGSDRRYSFSYNNITKIGGGDVNNFLLSSNLGGAVPEEDRDHVEVDIIGNNIINYRGILVYSINANIVRLFDNKITCLNTSVGSTPRLMSSSKIDYLTSGNNVILSDVQVGDTNNISNISRGKLDCTYELISTNIIGPQMGLTILPKNFSYNILTEIEISNADYGNIYLSIPIFQEFDSVDSWINYTDFTSGIEYRIKLIENMTLGNGSSSNHSIFTLRSPNTGSTIGTIRIYVFNGYPRLSIVLSNNNNYKINRIDHVQN